MNPIKVKITEKHEGRLVCRGKLIFTGDYAANCITGYYGTNDGKGNLKLTSTGNVGDYFITPIIISDIEEINIGDKFLIQTNDSAKNSKVILYDTKNPNLAASKIIIPEKT